MGLFQSSLNTLIEFQGDFTFRRCQWLLLSLILIVFIFPAPGSCDWDEACELAAARIQQTQELRQVPKLVFKNKQGDPCSAALGRALTGIGYQLVPVGPWPQVVITKQREGKNRFFWERPYKSYVFEVRISDKGKEIRSVRATHTDTLPSPYQEPIRIFLALALGGLIYWSIYQAGAYRSLWAWLIGVFVWILFAGFLAYGYFLPGILM
jgi:hypothetical protein